MHYLDGDEPAEVGVAGRSAGASGSAPAAGGVAGGQRPEQSRRTTWSRKDMGSTIEWVRLPWCGWCTASTVSKHKIASEDRLLQPIVGVKQQTVTWKNQRPPAEQAHTTRNLYTLCTRS